MKRKSTLFLLMTTILLIAFLVPACQKKYELDDQALLQLQCNASDAESIIDEIGETSETTVEETESEPTESEPTESEPSETTPSTAISETSKVTETSETTKATAAETTKKPTETTAAPSTRVAPVVTAVASGNSVVVSWNKITNPDLVGYKVVASKSDSTPVYSENGYYAWITDRNVTSCTIDNGDCYNNGDVGCFSGGTAYYFSVTAIYGSEWQKIAGNAVQVTMPGTAAPTPTTKPTETTAPTDPATRVAPVVTVSLGTNSVTVSWNKITSPDLVGYKVVASISDSTPVYSENGYYAWITDANVTSCTIENGDGYESGDVGCFTGGQAYYFSVTAIYGDEWQKVAGNAVQATMPGDPAVPGTHPASTLYAPVVGGDNVSFSWSKTADTKGFCYYKLVASQTNPNPTYPADGHIAVIDNPDVTGITKSFTDGLGSGTWYIGITTVYDDCGITYAYSNVCTIVIP